MPVKYADMIIVHANELLTLDSNISGPRIGLEMSELGLIEDGAVAIKDGKIIAVGKTGEFEDGWHSNCVINAKRKVVMPGFVDCHTHAVFAGSRERGEEIYYTVERTRGESVQQLLESARKRLEKMLRHGTTTVEIKSGYGLSSGNERRILHIISELKKKSDINIVITFLGAHVCPKEIEKNEYVKDVCWMLEHFGDNIFNFCDIWCEKAAFFLEETEKILAKAKEKGFKIKLHAGQLSDIGAVELGVKYGATSIDHLDFISDKGIEAMAKSKTIGVLLPGVSFHLMTKHYAPAREMIAAGVPIALATDFNPGSSPIISMQVIIGLACRQMKMTPAEAIVASTINAAHAIGLADKVGSLALGKQADIIILDIPNYYQLPYWFGQNLVETVIKKGKIVVAR